MDRIRFDRFVLDPTNRVLTRDDAPVDLNARYLDALGLLVRQPGQLVLKEQFMGDVWRGVPVTDEALTQCIRTLRRKLGDDAARPRFIETVPKHGYRFIAPVEAIGQDAASRASPTASDRWRHVILLGGAGTLGAGLAGIIGGLCYGFIAAAQPSGGGMGAASVLLVLLWLTIAAALMGGAGVSFGIAGSRLASRRAWSSIVGGALGGLIIGGTVKLLGLDAFNLLLGQSPGDITGAGEGVVLGGSVGLATWLASRVPHHSLRRRIALAALIGGVAGLLITALGGRLLGGSLDLVARGFPDSRLRLDPVGTLLGEPGFGALSQIVTGTLEGSLFGGCIVGAMLIARRSLARG